MTKDQSTFPIEIIILVIGMLVTLEIKTVKRALTDSNVTEFTLSFKVDSLDLKVGGLPIECHRQFQASTLSLNLISPKSRWLKPPSSRFFSWLPTLNENPAVMK